MFLVLAALSAVSIQAAPSPETARPGRDLIKATPQFKTKAACEAALKRQHPPTSQRAAAAPTHRCVQAAAKGKDRPGQWDLVKAK